MVRVEVIGDPLKVEKAFRERNEVQRKHMEAAMVGSMHHLRDVWRDLAPIGAMRDVNENYPTWHPRMAGTYRRSIKVVPVAAFGEDNLIGAVESDDSPVAKILESGSGLYREGPGARRKIYPNGRRFLAIPSDQMAIGGNRSRKGEPDPGARFLRSVRGQRPQHIARRARIISAPYTRERFKLGARLAAAEIKEML